jgi:L-amino acid N-acyltransferase YncA
LREIEFCFTQRRKGAKKFAFSDATRGNETGGCALLAGWCNFGMLRSMHIRPATIADAAAIAAIYAHHVEHGTASYDTEPRGVAATAALIADHDAWGWPFIVAGMLANSIAGYAYASQFKPRAGYAWTCEDSIYIHPDHQGQGVGRALLTALVTAAERCGFRNMVAGIGGAEPASVALHAACGFVHAGRLAGMGWKQGRWLDTIYMQRMLGEGTATPPGAVPGGAASD